MKSKLAVWRPVAYKGLSKRTLKNAAVLHTEGFDSGGSLFAGFSKNASGGNGPDKLHVGAHLYVQTDGGIEQYVDTDFSLGHAWDANGWAIGIETQDNGKCETAWTKAQVASIVALLKELDIPAQVLKEGPSDGVGWHRLYDSWNKSNHACPCNTREDQITEDILPGLEDDMGIGNDYFAKLDEKKLGPAEWAAKERFQWGYMRRILNEAKPPDDQDQEQKGWEHADFVLKLTPGGSGSPVKLSVSLSGEAVPAD